MGIVTALSHRIMKFSLSTWTQVRTHFLFLNKKLYFSCTVVSNERCSSRGFGVSTTQIESLGKAIIEGVERATIKSSSSSGIAAGFSRKNAQRRALSEAIERDTYVRWYRGEIEGQSIDLNGNQRITEVCDVYGLGVLAIHFLYDDECVKFGLGFGQNSIEARERAFLELGLSQIRHTVRKKCEPAPDSTYDQLHDLTKIPAVRNRLINSISKNPAQDPSRHSCALEYSFDEKRTKGLIPIYILVVRSKLLIAWDLVEMSKPLGQGNYRCASIPPEILPYGIPLG